MLTKIGLLFWIFVNLKNIKMMFLSLGQIGFFTLGAHTNLEYCELNENDAYLTNTESVKYAVHIANETLYTFTLHKYCWCFLRG